MYKNSRLWSVLSYITWIGWILAFVLRDRNDPLVRRHINQALILNIVSIVVNIFAKIGGLLGKLGGLLGILCLVFLVWGIIRAIKGSDEPLPIIGEYQFVQ